MKDKMLKNNTTDTSCAKATRTPEQLMSVSVKYFYFYRHISIQILIVEDIKSCTPVKPAAGTGGLF